MVYQNVRSLHRQPLRKDYSEFQNKKSKGPTKKFSKKKNKNSVDPSSTINKYYQSGGRLIDMSDIFLESLDDFEQNQQR